MRLFCDYYSALCKRAKREPQSAIFNNWKKEWNRSWKNDKESKLSVRKTNKKLQEIP